MTKIGNFPPLFLMVWDLMVQVSISYIKLWPNIQFLSQKTFFNFRSLSNNLLVQWPFPLYIIGSSWLFETIMYLVFSIYIDEEISFFLDTMNQQLEFLYGLVKCYCAICKKWRDLWSITCKYKLNSAGDNTNSFRIPHWIDR